MVPVHEVVQQLHDVVLVVLVLPPQEAQQVQLDARLDHERALRLDDLDGHVHARVPVLRAHHLAEGALPDALLHLVALVQHLPDLDDVVVVLVVVPLVVHAVALAVHERRLQRLLRVVDAVDQLVRVDQAHGKLVHRPLERLPRPARRRRPLLHRLVAHGDPRTPPRALPPPRRAPGLRAPPARKTLVRLAGAAALEHRAASRRVRARRLLLAVCFHHPSRGVAGGRPRQRGRPGAILVADRLSGTLRSAKRRAALAGEKEGPTKGLASKIEKGAGARAERKAQGKKNKK